ncbi:Putative leucyl-tRNA synthetase, cytoplasmic [Taphrina deformans PYCC 5710]|uniref:leucine--tRNA ligase n=1 Tax=Taphrina deformans (strain PYCC 5710 / ATCC 11124 / CBS 356.35 / IMI 108563 / JCM 9778 / NBRC 8474) TaxID=1097556 RepID=R4XAW7_TAPDE|nr:Putative leucyl-tRNA synthetase, cytoplasmic [Taphrina deformans PYCC 5710]|eukprot:CCG83009.1 Putative leucyl-tRNA synthetase, cytoplasmic [Taphrina deformans PYCC 5710]
MSTQLPDVGKLVIQNTTKRDTLQDVEAVCQARWKKDNVFQIDPPAYQAGVTGAQAHEEQPKFYGTMAYPYMNGSLHLGHAFTLTKVEFATGFARMQGKRALFPLGFHCTGMPIKSCADKLKNELKMFGPEFTLPDKPEEIEEPAQKVKEQVGEKDVTKFKGKKSKAVAKKGGMEFQFQIMQLLKIPTSEIALFADEAHWLEYFPPLCEADCTAFGARIDWRRSMITTDANPYYDAFVRWQMNKLHELQKVKFGLRYTVFSERDGQPCMDHDRASGEGKGATDYTGIKLRVEEWSDKALETIKTLGLKDKNVYFIAATLRPETMYGQTNCFVGPKISYGLYEAKNGEYYLSTARSARNMAWQDLFETKGQVKKAGDIKGDLLVGTLVNAPNSVYNSVRILPMDTVLSNKGTGVVTSVPSDSPDDFMTTNDLFKKAEYYGIKQEWASLKPIPIISTPTYGDLCAPKVCEMMKIQSPKDADLLAKAKEAVYKEGFYQGTMVHGKYSGEKVEKAKPLVRQDMIDAGLAFIYNEPEDLIMSRSGDECVIALCDQWYIDYGEASWRAETEACLAQMNTFGNETRNGFEQCLAWLNQWACSRSYGLGTRLPWDQQYLVESLSDSTIYMAYYTVAHWLHSTIDGSQQGKAGIAAKDMTDDVWEYILAKGPEPKTSIDLEILKQMRYEFEYFYPIDVRVSGKDLITNHLTFWMYTHTAIFDKEMWPRGVRGNGHLLLNGEKMSKSTGNFLTMKEAVQKFGADATRLSLADAGDSLEDANFEEATANAMILRLFTLKGWIEEQAGNRDSLRTGPYNFHDRAFDNEMNELIQSTEKLYEQASYRAALKTGLYDFNASRDWYREIVGTEGMHVDLVFRWIECQALLITPYAPHIAEHVWSDVLKHTTSVQFARFPKVTAPTDPTIRSGLTYLRSLSSGIHSSESIQLKKKSKGKSTAYDPKRPKRLVIYMSEQYPAWQAAYIDIIRRNYSDAEGTFDDKAIVMEAKTQPKRKDAMPFVQAVKANVLGRGEGVPASAVFERAQLFDEVDMLKIVAPFLKSNVGVVQLSVVKVIRSGDAVRGETVYGDEPNGGELPPMAEMAVPGSPQYHFTNVE